MPGIATQARPTETKPEQPDLKELREKVGADLAAATEPVVGKTLAAKLANVAKAVDRVEKRGWNSQQKYNFATAGDIFDEIRSKLGDQRVALRWSIDRENSTIVEVTSGGGTKGLLATLWITYAFVDGDTKEEFSYYTVGTANDFPGDKAVYKAQTNALKYLIVQTFLVSTGDDVENDSKDGSPSASYAGRQERTGTASQHHAPTPTALSKAEVDKLTALNTSLPTPKPAIAFQAIIRDLPYDKGLAQLTMAHDAQCGQNCEHVTGKATA